jgi:thiosulfate/3-mercaptopyruvate sulfurtransferase
MPVIIDVQDLSARLDAGEPVTLLDVRWALGDPRGRDHYRAGHLPGAVFADLDTELAAPPSTAAGRHPLPPVAELQSAARRWGVRSGQLVVAYDDSGNTAAARAWWLLRWGGHPQVLLLDGGLAAWRSAGLPLVTGDGEPPEPGDVTLSGSGLGVLDADAVAALARTGVVLDARAVERYRGDTEPIDPRAGHIPGAVSAPTGRNLLPDGRFRPAAELRDRFAELGADGSRPVAAYCGSGVTAAHEIAALAIAGIDAALYPGSWSQWSADADRPAAVGPDAG